jgi:hypothetical protein
MKITIQLRESYGGTRAYPVCPVAKLMAELAERTTLTARDLSTIQKMGYAIECQSSGVLDAFNRSTGLNIQTAP